MLDACLASHMNATSLRGCTILDGEAVDEDWIEGILYPKDAIGVVAVQDAGMCFEIP